MRNCRFSTALILFHFVVLIQVTPSGAQNSVGVRAGTTGVGLELGHAFSPSIDGRLVVSGFDYGRDFETDNVKYQGDAEVRVLMGVFDWHPGESAFRLSIGAVYNDTAIVGSAPVRGLVAIHAPELLDIPQLPDDLGTLRAKAKGEELTPYLGFGWGRVSERSGWGVSLDIGAFWFGEPQVSLVLDTSLPIGAVPGARALVDEALEQERLALQEELNKYKIFPVISLGATYRF